MYRNFYSLMGIRKKQVQTKIVYPVQSNDWLQLQSDPIEAFSFLSGARRPEWGTGACWGPLLCFTSSSAQNCCFKPLWDGAWRGERGGGRGSGGLLPVPAGTADSQSCCLVFCLPSLLPRASGCSSFLVRTTSPPAGFPGLLQTLPNL